MPDAIAAACSGCIAPSGNSADMVTASLAALSLPAITPPNLKKSFSFNADGLPAPTTIRRCALIPPGARISSVEPLLPLNWLVAAARLMVLATAPSAFRLAAPNFNASSQNTTRMPRDAAENGTKPTLTASDIGKSSRIQGCSGGPERPPKYSDCSLRWRPKAIGTFDWQHYDLSAAALPSTGVAPRPHALIY